VLRDRLLRKRAHGDPGVTDSASTTGEVTRILANLADGDRHDVDRLLAIVYDELRVIAEASFRRERADHTLQPTALVHDAFLRLVGQEQIAWRSRSHFFAAAAGVIRRILVDHARGRAALKRGGGNQRRLTLSAVGAAEPMDVVDLLALEDALARLGEIDARLARIVELRYYGGLTVEEVAEVLAIGKRTVDREWQTARTWLYRALHDADADEPPEGDPEEG
jgi:RNA polymerase sigma factor (TIGR02999 family)